MPTRLSKTRKHRGHVSAGRGRVGKQYVDDGFPLVKVPLLTDMTAESIPVDVVWQVVNIITEPVSLQREYCAKITLLIVMTDLDKYHPGYFGKVGMRYFHKQPNHFWKPVINLDKVCIFV
jgi:large subunit ribosomal protein L27Ae